MPAKKENKKKGPFIRSKKGIALIVFMTIVILAALFLIFQIEDIAERRLLNVINAELEPNAEIEFGEFSFSLMPAGLYIRDIRLNHLIPFEEHTPVKSTDAIKNLKVDRIEFTGINVFRMLYERKWILNKISADGLALELVPLTAGGLEQATPFRQPPPFLIDNIILKNSSLVTFSDRSNNDPKYTIENIHGELFNFSVPDIEDPVYTYFDDFLIQSSAFRYNTDNGFYKLGYDSVSVNSSDRTFYLKNGKAEPLLTALEMAEEIGYENDQFNFFFEELFAEDVDFDLWFEERGFVAGGVRMEKPVLHIHRDKSMPREERDERPLPIRYLKEYPQKIGVDSILFRGGTISYTEDFTDVGRKGQVEFTEANLTFENLQNQYNDHSISVRASSRFMDLTDFQIRGDFTLEDNFSHVIRGSMSGFDLTRLNDPLSEWIYVRVREGNLDQLDFYFSADDDRARGEMHFIYHDLEIRFLDEETLEETRRRRFRSFVANLVRVHSSNTFDDTRTGTIDFERDKERSIFNYWWRSIASGLEDSVKR